MKEVLEKLPHLINTQETLPPHLPEANPGLASFVKKRLSSLDSEPLSSFQEEYQDKKGRSRRRITEAGRDFAQELYQEMLFQAPGCSFETLSQSLSLAYQELKEEGFEHLSQVRGLFSSIRGQKRVRDLRYEAVHKLGIKPDGGIVLLQKQVAQVRKEKEHQKRVDKAVGQTGKATAKKIKERIRTHPAYVAGMAMILTGTIAAFLKMTRPEATPASAKEKPAAVFVDNSLFSPPDTSFDHPWNLPVDNRPSPSRGPNGLPKQRVSATRIAVREQGGVVFENPSDRRPPRETSHPKAVVKENPIRLTDFDFTQPVTIQFGDIATQAVKMVVGTKEELLRTRPGGQGEIALRKGEVLRVLSTQEDIPDQTALHTWSVIITQRGEGASLVKKVREAGDDPRVLIGETIVYGQNGRQVKEKIIKAKIVPVEKLGKPKEVFPQAKQEENVIWTCYRWTLRGTTHLLVLWAVPYPQPEPIIPQGLTAE